MPGLALQRVEDAPDRAGSAGGGHHRSMAETLVARPTAAGIDLLPAPHPTIRPATDLGGVTVLKHGNFYLLTDAQGDIHPDTRGLGLYDLDTRILSCAILRVNGVRPTLLRGRTASNHTGVIQLLNPETRRDPAIKQDAADALALRSLSITRRRWISGGLAERIEVTNFSERPQLVVLDLEFDVDAADIFEVRGKARPARGRFRPTEATDHSLRFAYEGLDGLVRRTLIAFSPAEDRRPPAPAERWAAAG